MQDYSTRQYISHMLSKLGLDRKAAAALTASEEHLAIYIELLKLAAKNREDIQELLYFSGIA